MHEMPHVSAIGDYTDDFELIPLHLWNKETLDDDMEVVFWGKRPLGNDWTKKPINMARLRALVRKGHNFGVRLKKGQLVVDVDPRNFPEGRDVWAEFQAATGLKPEDNVTVRTGSGGYHVFLNVPKDFKKHNQHPDFPGIEFKSYGQQVVAVGSLHPETGKPYELIGDHWMFMQDASPEVIALAGQIRKDRASTGGGELSAEQLEQILENLDVADFATNDKWEPLLFSIHDATGGCSMARDIFDAWCARGVGYTDDVTTRWDSLDTSKEVRMGIGTLKKIAGDLGATKAVNVIGSAMMEQRASAADDFADDIEDHGDDGRTDDFAGIDDDDDDTSPETVKPKGPTEMEQIIAEDWMFDGEGNPYKNRHNYVVGLWRLGVRVYYDALRNAYMLDEGKMFWDRELGDKVNDETVLQIRSRFERTFGAMKLTMTTDKAFEALYYMGQQNTRNRVTEYLDSVEWDGTPRIDRLFVDYFPCGDTPFTRDVGRAFLTGAVARAFKPGCKRDEMVIVKGKQGHYKSTGFRILGGEFFSDADLGDLKDTKQAVENMDGSWIHEIAEVDQFKTSDVAKLKGFISRQVDHFRPAYARTVKTFPRRSVFCGTCNEGGFLSDATGNRRYWMLDLGDDYVDTAALRADRDQIWAEAVIAFRAGDMGVLSKDVREEAEERAVAETMEHPWADLLRIFLEDRADQYADEEDASAPPNRVHTSELLSMVKAKPHSSEAQKIRTIMETVLGWTYKRQVKIDGRVSTGFTT